MKQKDFKAAILDMDGVITRTARTHARVWKQAFDEHLARRAARGDSQADHAPFDPVEDYRKYVDGMPRHDGVRSFLQSRGIDLPWGDPSDAPDRETICGVGNRKNQLFQEELRRGGVEVYDDTVRQVHAWKKMGWKLAVISSSRNCEAVLKAANLLDLFDARVDGRDLDRLHMNGKPAADMFLHAARLLGVEPRQAIVVEDAIAGVQAGRSGGFGLVVGVTRGGMTRGREDLRQAGADIVVADLGNIFHRENHEQP